MRKLINQYLNNLGGPEEMWKLLSQAIFKNQNFKSGTLKQQVQQKAIGNSLTNLAIETVEHSYLVRGFGWPQS